MHVILLMKSRPLCHALLPSFPVWELDCAQVDSRHSDHAIPQTSHWLLSAALHSLMVDGRSLLEGLDCGEARATMKSRIGGGKRRRNHRLGCTCIVFLGRSSAAAHGAIFGRRFFIIGGGPNNLVQHRQHRRTQHHGTRITADTEWRRRGGSLEEEERKDDNDANRAPSHHVSPPPPLDSFRREVREIMSGCRDDLQEILSGVERDVRQELIARKEKALQEAMEERHREEEEEEQPEFDEDLLNALSSSSVVDADDDYMSSQNRLDIFTELPTESDGDRLTEDEDFDEDLLNALSASSIVDAEDDYVSSQKRLDIFTELPTESDGDRLAEDEDDSESSVSWGLSDIDFVVGDTDEEEDAVVERLSTPPSVDDEDEEETLSVPIPEKIIDPAELVQDDEPDQSESVAVADESTSGGDTDQLPVPKPFTKKKMRTGYKKKQKKSKSTVGTASIRAVEEVEPTILFDDGLPVPTMTSTERKKKKKRPTRRKKKSESRSTMTLPAIAEESELEMSVEENFESTELVDAESSAVLNAVQSLLKLVVATMCFLFACTVINIVMNIVFRTLHKPAAK